jgi:hypothetical protein
MQSIDLGSWCVWLGLLRFNNTSNNGEGDIALLIMGMSTAQGRILMRGGDGWGGVG